MGKLVIYLKLLVMGRSHKVRRCMDDEDIIEKQPHFFSEKLAMALFYFSAL